MHTILADLIMDADTESSIDAIRVKQPPHAHQHKVEVIYSRRLHHPVHLAGDKLTGELLKEIMV